MLVFAFIGVPLIFNVFGLSPTVVQVSAAMVDAAPTPTPDPEGARAVMPASANDPAMSQASASQYKTLRMGDTDEIISDIQLRLMELEYLDGDEPTDVFGEQTVEALKRFQRIHHMNETGEADALTQELLFSSAAAVYHLKEGDAGNDVKRLQNQLYDLGYYGEKLNGYFGSATGSALTAFQTKNKLNATGVADQDTRDVLYSSEAQPKVDPTPTPADTPKPSAKPKPSATPKASATPKPSATAKQTASPKPDASATETPDQIIVILPTFDSSGGSWTDQVPSGSGMEAMIAVAESRLGCPYVYANEGPDSFDCSGFVYFCLRSAGVKVGRMSAKSFARIDSWQTINDRSSLQRGDLLFFTNSVGASDIGHTGIYMGGGKYIHASSSAGKVVISSWSDWSTNNFQWAKRVF